MVASLVLIPWQVEVPALVQVKAPHSPAVLPILPVNSFRLPSRLQEAEVEVQCLRRSYRLRRLPLQQKHTSMADLWESSVTVQAS